MFNQQKLDFPGFLWGDVAVVFNNSAVADMTMLQPVDTGDYVCDCNDTFTRHFCAEQNTTAECKFMWMCNSAANGTCVPKPSTPAKNCSSWQYVAPRHVSTMNALLVVC